MQYISTRDRSVNVTSAFAIKQGLSLDGGLFVPESIPEITDEEAISLVNMSYNERATFVLSKFLTDFSVDEISDMVNKAYTKEKFETECIAPLYKLDNKSYCLELWHGPTCAFKDMALQLLPHLLTRSVKKTKDKREVVILVATSGDTGKAALEGFHDVNGTRIIVFYPDKGVSEIQKTQMITQDGGNVSVSAVYGNFDDAQKGVKQIFVNKDYIKELERNGFLLSSANSINWGRLVPQIVYYISSYYDLVKNNEIKFGDKINVCVPTGNFGNILAAFYAKEMGLPINKFICASNKNNILTDFIKTGVYDKNREFFVSNSPAMDILVSSNLERLLFALTGYDSARIKEWMQSLESDGKYQVPEITKNKLNDMFFADFCDEEQTIKTIKKVNDEYGYVIDTHTAVAKFVYDKYIAETGDDTKTIIISTASPFKFCDSVLKAFISNSEISKLDEYEMLDKLSEISDTKCPSQLSSLKEKVKIFNMTCEKEQMIQVVNDFLVV